MPARPPVRPVSRRRTPPALALGAAAVLAAFASFVAGLPFAAAGEGSGVLDREVPNRAAVRGSISTRGELDTMRLRVPAGAAMQCKVSGSGKLVPEVRILGPDDTPVDVGNLLRRTGRTTKLLPFTPPAPGLYRIDVRGGPKGTGEYRFDASWNYGAKVAFSGTTGADGSTFTFDAEEGTRLDIALKTSVKGATIRAARITGPDGFSLDVALPRRLTQRHVIHTPPAPASGTYELTIVTDTAGRSYSGTVTRRAPTARPALDLRSAERFGAGVARTVTRVIANTGGRADVPSLDDLQRVSIDTSGVCLEVPAGAVSAPAVFEIRSDDDQIDDPLQFAPAGASVHFDAGGIGFQQNVMITLPFDVGAFTDGNPQTDICVLRRADDGNVFEVPQNSYVVDGNAGTVTFPTATFSSYQAFSPPVELVNVVDVRLPHDLTPGYDDGMLYITSDIIDSVAIKAGILRYTPGGTVERFAGGGTLTGDGVHRLDYDFDADIGGSGALIQAFTPGPNGEYIVVTSDVDETFSVAYIILDDGIVVRVAGNGTAFTDESAPSRETGLPLCRAAAVSSDGIAVLVTDAFLYPESDRVLAVYSSIAENNLLRIVTIAGGGTSDRSGAAPLDMRLFQPRSVLIDFEGRVVVGDRDWILRFDFGGATTETLAGTNFGETEEGSTGDAIGGVGAPPRTVKLGVIEDVAFAPGREDILYAADPESGIVWRFDLARRRTFIAAGRRVNFDEEITTREPDPDVADPQAPLNFPVAVAPIGGEVFIAERFVDRVYSRRRVR